MTAEAAVPARTVPWELIRKAAAVLAVMVLAAVLIALMTPDRELAALDPRSAAPDGTRAVAEVLRGQGVQVELAETTDQALAGSGPASTLVVAEATYLSSVQARRLRDVPGDVVLFDPTPRVLDTFAPGVRQQGAILATRRQDVAPQCEAPVPSRAGVVDAGGGFYEATDPAAQSCYRQTTDGVGEDSSGPTLVQLPRPGGTLTVLGNPGLLTNERLGERGNAALALGLLGENARLTWYIASPFDVPAGGEKTTSELLPDGVLYGALTAVLAALVFAAWRARRLGPVVTEPLPVVVRAAETAEGRSRLYRRGRAYDAAARALRAATLRRVRSALGLGRGATDEQVHAAAAARSGRTPQQVAYLLHGPPPTHDTALVGLADELDRLDREVRHS